MNPERRRQVEELYHAALKREHRERAAFVAQVAEGDPELRSEVESLLAKRERPNAAGHSEVVRD